MPGGEGRGAFTGAFAGAFAGAMARGVHHEAHGAHEGFLGVGWRASAGTTKYTNDTKKSESVLLVLSTAVLVLVLVLVLDAGAVGWVGLGWVGLGWRVGLNTNPPVARTFR